MWYTMEAVGHLVCPQLMLNRGYNYSGFLTWGYPHIWMVFVREIPTKLDDLGGTPILGNFHMTQAIHMCMIPERFYIQVGGLR